MQDKKKFVKTWEMKIDDKDCEATQQGWWGLVSPEKKRTNELVALFFSMSNMMPASDDGTPQPRFLFLVPEKIDYVQRRLFRYVYTTKASEII